jgi:hypothetical protein
LAVQKNKIRLPYGWHEDCYYPQRDERESATDQLRESANVDASTLVRLPS